MTVADFGAQAIVSHLLALEFPHDPLVGEEDADALREHAEMRAKVVDSVRTVLPDLHEDEILGAIRYIAEQGLNSLYVVMTTLGGDGNDVWPWIEASANSRRFDVSKLDQWQRVFDYAQTQGIHINMLLNEEENVLSQNGGNLGVERELSIARWSPVSAT